jgi:hypothetical protein
MDKARRDFGLTNMPMDEWLETIVEWYGSLDDQLPSIGYERRDVEVVFARKWRDRA